MTTARALCARTDRLFPTADSNCCHLCRFRLRACTQNAFSVRFAGSLNTSALGRAKVDMSTIHTNYKRLSVCQMIFRRCGRPSTKGNRLLIIRRGAKARCRQFSNKCTAQERRHCCVVCETMWTKSSTRTRQLSGSRNTHVWHLMLKSCGIKELYEATLPCKKYTKWIWTV